MNNPNHHISEYFDYYLGLRYSPEFAVMINAPWGAGKTYFIQEYLQGWRQGKPDNKILFISLYGMDNFSEIDDAIFQQMHPFLSSPKMKLLTKVSKGFLKGTLKIDLDINRDGQKESLTINSQLPDFKKEDLPNWLKNSDKSILVFDDLERSNLEISRLLGYINQFNEHQNHKIILIANEEQIAKKDTSYQQIKEKLIGKTFLLMGDHESAISTFINQTTCTQTKNILSAKKTLILEFIQRYENHNLRIIQQIFYDFERLIHVLNDDILENQNFLTELLKVFLVTCYEYKKGTLKTHQLSWNYLSTLVGQTIEQQNLSELKEKHPLYKYESSNFISSPTDILSLKFWEEILDKSYFNPLQINEHFRKTEYFSEVPLWVKLWKYRSLTDEQLIFLLKQVKTDIQNRKIHSAWEILHLWGIFLTYHQAFNIITSAELDSLKNQLLENAKNLINPFPNYPYSLLKASINCLLDDSDNSHTGYSYQSNQKPQFINFRKELEIILLTHIGKLTQKRVDEIFEILKSNPNNFATQLAYEAGDDFIPSHIMIQLDTKKLVEAYNRLEGSQQFEINLGLYSRYNNRIQSYLEEETWLESLTCEFDALKQTLEASPSQVNKLKLYRLNLINDELKGIVLKMKKD